MVGEQYEKTSWVPKSQARSRTIHNRFGSWAKASEAVGVSHNTLRSWARGDTQPTAGQQTKMNRMVGQYRGSESAMRTITKTSLRQDRIAERRGIREARDAGMFNPTNPDLNKRRADAEMRATPLHTQAELDYVADLLEEARESDDPDDWSQFRNSYSDM